MRWLVTLCTVHHGGKAGWQQHEVAGRIASSQEWRGTKTGWCSACFPFFSSLELESIQGGSSCSVKPFWEVTLDISTGVSRVTLNLVKWRAMKYHVASNLNEGWWQVAVCLLWRVVQIHLTLGFPGPLEHPTCSQHETARELPVSEALL